MNTSPAPYTPKENKHPLIKLGAVGFFLVSSLVWLVGGIDATVNGLPAAVGTATEWMADIQPVKPNDFDMAVSERTGDCPFDESKWSSGFGKLEKNEERDSYVLASTTQSSLLQYRRSLTSRNEIEFTFVPLSEHESNIAILAHDLFEITIGDDGNRRIILKANLAQDEKMSVVFPNNELGRSFLLPEEFAMGREVTVRVVPRPNGLNEEELIVTVYYYPSETASTQKSATKEYRFPIPEDFRGTDKPIRLSVGILNTDNKHDLEARFKCFRVSLSDSNPVALSGE